jgi:hypothetical protein
MLETKTAEKVHIPLRDVDPQDAPLTRVTSDAAPPMATSQAPSGPAAIFNRPRVPWLRRHGTAVLVVLSVATGAVLQMAASRIPWSTPKAAAPGRVDAARILGPITLQGPGGPVTLPMSTPAVVNVWLEGCQDCMPAVEAYHALKTRGVLETAGFPVVNVAYGGARLEWAAGFGLDDRLVFDPSGGALVRPLGIGTFTTILVDPEGWIRFKDRPDNNGYADRLAGAARALASDRRNAKKDP